MIKYNHKLDENKYIPYMEIEYNTKFYDIMGALLTLNLYRTYNPIDELCTILAEDFKNELKQTIQQEIIKYNG